jgi:hypothetical protein
MGNVFQTRIEIECLSHLIPHLKNSEIVALYIE